MKPKTLVTIILSLFVMISVVYLIVDEMGKKPPEDAYEGENAVHGDSSEGEIIQPPEAIAENVVVVYYFHGNFRCHSCLTIEELTRDAVLGGFEEELRDGRLELRVINMQDPLNREYVEKFQLKYYIVVLERIENGQQQDWKNLEDVWDLYTDRDRFIEYVQTETRSFMEGM
jgi:hypothetical protein